MAMRLACVSKRWNFSSTNTQTPPRKGGVFLCLHLIKKSLDR